MALGFGNKKTPVVDSSTTYENGVNDPVRRDPSLQTGVYGYDVEKTGSKGRKMSRIAGAGLGESSDSDSAMSVGKQIELEATSSIKYRTCSWPKVNTRFSLFPCTHQRRGVRTLMRISKSLGLFYASRSISCSTCANIDPTRLLRYSSRSTFVSQSCPSPTHTPSWAWSQV